jgi:N utilization substance protein B|tara:strand:- start:2145 stop:2579 length:435 start_codon:yes stop_codon:yes gene_type:complete
MSIVKQSRRSAREAVLQALYAVEIGEEIRSKALKDILGREQRDSETKDFIVHLFEVSLENRDWCEEQIKSRLNNWEFKRVAVLDRLLLVIALAEIFFIDTVPPKVSISEAIQIAKKYSTEDSSAFINGVLDNIYKNVAEEKLAT